MISKAVMMMKLMIRGQDRPNVTLGTSDNDALRQVLSMTNDSNILVSCSFLQNI